MEELTQTKFCQPPEVSPHIDLYLFQNRYPRAEVQEIRQNIQAQRNLVAHLERMVKELWSRVDYFMEKNNQQGEKQDEEEGGSNLVTVKTSIVSVKQLPLQGPSKINNDGAKAPDDPYYIDQMVFQENGWEEISKWVIGEVRGTCCIRSPGVPFWGFVVVNSQLNVVGISVL